MNQVVSLVENFSDEWFRFIVSSSVQLAIFLSVIGIVTFIFRKKSAIFLYFLWLVGLFRVILPPDFNFFFRYAVVSPNFIPTIQIQEIVLMPTSAPGEQLSMQGYLFLFWLTGVIIFTVYWLFNYVRFRRVIRHDVTTFSLPEDVKKIIKNHRVQVLTGPFIATPFVRGIFHSKIYLPENASHWPEQELKAILYHELAHIHCKDLFLIIFQNAVQMIYFFHPLVWLANMQIFRYREKARDDLAIEKMGGNALAYGKYLLTSMDNAMEWQPMYSTSHYFLQSKSFLYQRFEYILKRKEKIMNRLTHLQKGVLVGCLIVGLALTAFQSDIRSQTENSRQQKENVQVQNPENFQEVKQEIINGRKVVFAAFDKAPEPEGGFGVIQENLVYPEAARKAGKEGKVLVYTQIGADGKIIDAFVGHSTVRDESCDAAALQAVKSMVWNPALKEGKPIAVWIIVPVNFKIYKPDEQKPARTEKGQISSPLPPKELPPPPPPAPKPPQTVEEGVVFVPYDEAPRPIGGFAAIQKNLQYPEIARKACIEGTVVIYAKISKDGAVEETKIVKSLGKNNGLDEAAVAAVKKTKWKPAKQKDKSVGVWVSVPVKFKLANEKKGTTSDMKEVEQKLQKIEQDLAQKEKLLQAQEDKKTAKELKKIKEDLQTIQEKLKEKNKELQKLNEKMEKVTEEKSITVSSKPSGETPSVLRSDEEIIFVPYDKPPAPEGGFKAIQRNLIYPELARKNKIEGTVILYVQITEKGEVGKVHVQKPLDANCNQAAIDAVKRVKWKPAKQKGKPVAVWVSVPIIFKLK
ncbi:MAG: TonB family protein [Calditrichaeota bacterium]|nr:TonB family protein [Calditrichota bacterium]